MIRFDSYLSEAIKLIEAYKGKMPFSVYTKNYFAQNKKFGSTDRKVINKLCYYFFRVSHAVSASIKDAIIAGIFLCEKAESEILEYFNPSFNKAISKSILEKFEILKVKPESFFSFSNYISDEIDVRKFGISFLQQPDLFLRIRPGKKFKVVKKLEDAGIEFHAEKDWIKLDNSAKIDKLISLNKEAVVQDINSQKVFNFFGEVDKKREYNVWDCCAASGGKSILLFDRFKGRVKITASDLRPSILENLKIRLHKADIKMKKLFVADLSMPVAVDDKFDIIICDAPCTGSGTWARTPEQLYIFKENSIADYSQLQKKIIDNSMPSLKIGGLFCYITCSVFKEENEANAKYISDKFSMEKLHSEYLKGYENKADTLFVSIFKSVS